MSTQGLPATLPPGAPENKTATGAFGFPQPVDRAASAAFLHLLFELLDGGLVGRGKAPRQEEQRRQEH